MRHPIKKTLARLIWLITGYKHASTAESLHGPRIFVGAPHTSNWDFLLMLATAWELDIKVHWLGKKEMFPKPLRPLLYRMGGISVDRKNPGSLVRQLIKRGHTEKDFALVITPEGTRGGDGWKSGFYRIAQATNMPVTLCYVDGKTKTAGVGITLTLTGNVKADMDRIRDYFKDKHGYHPHKRTEPWLKEENQHS